jgi:hypothetical protein
VFDINDVTFAQSFIARRLFNSSLGSWGYLPAQLAALDIDGNGAVSGLDAFFLLRVNFRLLRFITNVTVAPVSRQTGCRLVIGVTALVKGDEPAPAAQTLLYVDIESEQPALEAAFDASVVVRGAGAAGGEGRGLPRRRVAADRCRGRPV